MEDPEPHHDRVAGDQVSTPKLTDEDIHETIARLTTCAITPIPEWLTCLNEDENEHFYHAILNSLQSKERLDVHPTFRLSREATCQADLNEMQTCKLCRVSTKNVDDAAFKGACFAHPAEECDNFGICRRCNPTYGRSEEAEAIAIKGCVEHPQHEWGSLGGEWEGFVGTPTAVPGVVKRRVICIDSELCGVWVNKWFERSEMVTFSAVDALTNEVVMNCIIKPDEKITNYRETWTGMNEQIMLAAERQGKAIIGLNAFRAELFKHIDTETVIMGWAVGNDLAAMRLAHPRIFDMQIWNFAGKLSLEVEQRLGATIQSGIHSSLEDAMATVELARTNYCHEHKLLRQWRWQKVGEEKTRHGKKRKWRQYGHWACISCECLPNKADELEEIQPKRTAQLSQEELAEMGTSSYKNRGGLTRLGEPRPHMDIVKVGGKSYSGWDL